MLTSCLLTSIGDGYEDFVEETLREVPSFINQIFIINDTGKQILKNTNDDRFIYLDNYAKKGLSKSLEIWSKEYYKYDLIFRIDIGDKSTKERFQKQYDFMVNNNNYVLCGYQTKLIGSHNYKRLSFASLKSKLIKFILLFKNCYVHGSICIRSDSLKKVGGYNGHLTSCQDIDLYLKLLNFGKFAILKGEHHTHKFNKKLSTTLKKKKINYKITSLIRFNAAKKYLLLSPFLLFSSAYYYLKYLLKN